MNSELKIKFHPLVNFTIELGNIKIEIKNEDWYDDDNDGVSYYY